MGTTEKLSRGERALDPQGDRQPWTDQRPYLRRAVLGLYIASLAILAWCVIAFGTDRGMSHNGMGMGFLIVGAVGLVVFAILLGCTAWLWFVHRLRWPLWLPLGMAGSVLAFAFVSSSLQSCSHTGVEAIPAVAPPPVDPAVQDGRD